ncbi:MarR family winged helix-turn-helix transcriptional regulator [Persicitalea jodogahamensis]|uniref:MarR family transcriptional regulator n=1 Tax=Persicitalea jodogahamensis TaxID=402147 RepID=A0A8J3G897_9BACT|nr:MarR family transcriptional regulator [Persicitalea jodogahamensis]GHB56960.1 MarR family transcriptional regulator [Persicitalea jodogahamensis]
MSIEKAIKQTKFKTIYHKLVINLIYSGNWIVHQQYELLREYDLTPQQYNVLRILRGYHPKPMKVNAISERMLDQTSNTSRLVDKLLAKKLLIREVCSTDRRAVDVKITKDGLDLLSKIDPVIDEWEKNLHSISPEEAGELNNLLDKLRLPL